MHCLDGTTATGLLVLALRKIQLFDGTFALAEYARLSNGKEVEVRGGEGGQDQEHVVWINNFKPEMVFPSQGLPRWLWNGKRLSSKHPTVPVKYRESENASKGKRVASRASPSLFENVPAVAVPMISEEQLAKQKLDRQQHHRRGMKEKSKLREHSAISWLNLEI